MTYDQILTLDMIIKTGSFKAASEAMFKSQPSISQAIKKLEEEYQIQLFDRDHYRPTLTEIGLAFYNKSKMALSTFQELETYGKELGHGLEPEIFISLDAICPLKELSPVFENFFQPHISTSLNLNIDLLDGLQAKIINHEVDFGIGSMINRNDQIDSAPLMPLKMIPVISSKYNNEKNDIETYKRIPQIILTSSEKDKSQKIVGSFEGAKLWYTSDIYMKEQLISNGLGWGRLPEHLVSQKLKNKELIEIKNIKEIPAFSVTMHLLKSKTKVLGPTSRKLWEFISAKYSTLNLKL